MNYFLIKKALAAGPLSGPIVPPCNPTGPASDPATCNICHLALMGHNIITALMAIGFVITAIMVVVGGFRLYFSGGSPDRRQSARKHITAALTGLVIVLLAWVVIDTLLVRFGNLGESGQWATLEELDCEGPPPQ